MTAPGRFPLPAVCFVPCRRLFRALGRDERLELIWADMLASSYGMRRTAQSVGVKLIDQPGETTTRAELRLT
jgi:hypothetical protein